MLSQREAREKERERARERWWSRVELVDTSINL